MVFFALLIPLITATVLVFWFGRKVRWWEPLIPMGVSVLLIWGAKSLTEYAQIKDTEYWTGWVVKGAHHEHWNEQKSRQESYTVTVGSGKNRRTETRTKTVYYVVDHPEYWEVIDNNDIHVRVDRWTFEQLANRFNNRKFVNMHHNSHTIHGNKYETTWPGSDDMLEVVTTKHNYKNRILASDSVFKFRKTSTEEKEQYGLFEYPEVQNYYLPVILGYTDSVAERKFGVMNAKLGRSKQVRAWVTVFRDQPLDAGIAQENLWQGGNKNEIVLAIGIDNEDNVTWCHVFSWSEQEVFKYTLRDVVLDQEGKKINLSKIADDVKPHLESEWVRKQFKDFDYLTVEPPIWSVLLVYVLTLGVNVGLSVILKATKE